MTGNRTKNNPLFKHRNGQWAKKIRGKLHYFGTDETKALDRYKRNFERLKAGLAQQEQSGSPTLRELANVYLDRCRNLVSAGELTQRSLTDTTNTLRRLIDCMGAESEPSQWEPADFSVIKSELLKPVARKDSVKISGLTATPVKVRSPVTLAGDVRRIRAFLNWCAEDDIGHIPRPKFGRDFAVGRKALRRHKAKQGPGDLPADLIRAMIDRAAVGFKPFVLLGINAGLGALDISQMRLEQVEAAAASEWLSLPRGKTGAERKAWLWPETREAIARYLEIRKRPYIEAFEDIGFLTSQRRPWLEERDNTRKDSVSWTFTRLRKELGYERGTFYGLRKTFATIGSASLDQPAVDRVMGHLPPADDMPALYRQHIDDTRIRRVCEYVRQWLLTLEGASAIQ